MVVSRTHTRQLFSFAAAVLLSAALAFISFASSFPNEDVSSEDEYYVDLAVLQRTGVLKVVKGGVKVNGNPAKTGHTILSNDKIVTDPDAIAEVDLAPLGRITIREGTTVTLDLSVSVHVKSECARTRIEVFSGHVEVESPEKETLGPGKAKRYGGSVQATSRVAVFEIRCLSGRLGAFGRAGAGILAAALDGDAPGPVLAQEPSPVLP
ncbi:MAG: hypothetical protein AABO41_24710 [Acidobacteriota bacterium]